MKQKRLIISALSGGSGKTLVSLGLCSAFKERNYRVLPFKKGPDYIDTAWLSLATQQKAYNLDPFFLNKEELLRHFTSVCAKHQDKEKSIALIEGNRGLYDGMDIHGSSSTAELAYTIDTPVLLTIDAKKATRTLAALVNGIISFDSRISIAGLIFNNTASVRHEKNIYDCIQYYCSVPIFGFLPRFSENPLPERHLGLVLESDKEENAFQILEVLRKAVEKNIDIENIDKALECLPLLKKEERFELNQEHKKKVRIGYVKDKALWFYYTENLEALEEAGAELVCLSLFDETQEAQNLWDSIDALYIGGGYPEVYAEEIEQLPILQKIKAFADDNMPIYAECGGFMLLTHSIQNFERRYKMANIFPIDLEFYKKPQGLGYVEASVTKESLYFAENTALKGHEFHYSLAQHPPEDTLFTLTKGKGMGQKKDAVHYKNTFASYTHIYALTHKEWAVNFVNIAYARKLKITVKPKEK